MNKIPDDIVKIKVSVEELLAFEDYDVEEFSELWLRYQSELELYCVTTTETDRATLEAEQQWVFERQQQILAERQRIGGALLNLQNGRKAIDNYDTL